MLKLLSKIFLIATTVCQPVIAAEDHFERTIGLHLLANYGSKYSFLSSSVSQSTINHEIHKLDWPNSFYQLILVLEPGISMEVGGSLNPSDGLSARYLNRDTKTEAVIIKSPESVQEMENILVQFSNGGNLWKTTYQFDFVSYE